ncbi:unnamed protein product [Brassicogethes aeneus]|uniref:BRCT domain-containing protein n=1 Tax=Brassicogethes aeneus TaxID=1431903 RepID=A0A9P0APJ6_BRAAE|nr:unnamed protein product [Brassicogethes aeneus]
MKPKISTGFFTPPMNRKRKENVQTPVRNQNNEIIFSEEIYETIMGDPIKRKLMLQIFAQEKNAIEEYKRNEKKKKLVASSPLNKLKGKYKCESPTALLRRRALEQQAKENENDLNSERSSSRQSTSSAGSPVPSPIPFDKLLEGVRAYVEVRSKDQDRSAGAKALMISMGAKVRDVFTKDVTHVVFKDGGFSTYQKAKLMKVHLVSVLWLEAVRKNMFKVPEKEYPALGASTFDNDVSTVCSQIQKEYEDIIREEVRRSLVTGTPLPSTESLREKRRMTIMSPIISSSFSKFSQDEEVDRINRRRTNINPSFCRPPSATLEESSQSNKNRRRTDIDYKSLRPNSAVLEDISPELTSDDDSEVGLINGEKPDKAQISIDNFSTVIDDTILDDNSDNLLSYLRNKKPETSDMDLTNIQDRRGAARKSLREINAPQDSIDMELTGILNSMGKSGRKKLETKENTPKNTRNRRKTLFQETHVTKTTSSSDKSTNISDESLLKRINVNKVSSDNTNMSNLHLSSSDNIEILSKNCSSPLQTTNLNKSNSNTTTTTTNMSSLRVGSTKSATTTTRTDMSDLKVSSENAFKIDSRSTDMSSLKVSDNSASNGLDPNAREVNSKIKPVRSTKRNKKSDESSTMSSLRLSSDKNDLSSLQSKLFSTELASLRLSETVCPNESLNSSDKEKKRSKLPLFPTKSKDSAITKTATDNSFNDSSSSSEINYGRTRRQSKLPLTDSNLNDSAISRASSKLSFSPVDIISAISIIDDNITTRRKKINNKTPSSLQKESVFNDNASRRKSQRLVKACKEPNLETNTDISDEPLDKIKSNKKATPKNREINVNNNIDKFNLDEENIKNKTPKTPKSNKTTNKEIKNISDDKFTTKKTPKRNINKNVTEAEKTSTESEESSSDSPKKKQKRVRRLYNPTDSPKTLYLHSDDLERQEKRLRALKRIADEGLTISETISQNPPEKWTESVPTEPELESIKSPNKKLKAINKREAEQELMKVVESIKPPDKKPKKAKKEKDVSLNTSADEQKDLVNEFVNPKTPKRRPKVLESQSENSKRRSQRLTQKDQDYVFAVPTTPVRRSTLEFQSLSQSLKKVRIDVGKQPSIVCTKMHKTEVETFTSIVKKLGRFKTEDEVTRNTTHVVAGEPKRTINMLRAIALGCWVLKKEWLYASLEAGKWLPEEDFEETDFSHTVQQSRLQRQAFGSKYSMDVFRDVGNIYVAKSTTPRWSDLKELIEFCKGKIVLNPEKAKVIIGEYRNQDDTTCVKEVWVLDSITFYKTMPLKKYLLPPRNSSPCV